MTAPKKTNTPADKKIFDIAKPGKSAPTASGKPIIITNRPILKDPMVVDKSGPDAAAASPLAPSKPSTRVKISPLNDALQEGPAAPAGTDESEVALEKPEAEQTPALAEENPAIPTEPEAAVAPEAKTDPTDAATTTETTDVPAASESTAPAAKETTEENPAEDTTAPAAEEQPTPAAEEAVTAAPAPADNATATEGESQKPLSKADEEAARREAERQAELQKLIDSKKFYLPIDRKGKRRTKWHIILGAIIILLLAVVWADIALDSGMVRIAGVKPYTHFFNK